MLTVPVTDGAIAVFGISEEERAEATALAVHLRSMLNASPDEVASLIEARTPWLRLLAQQVREQPLATVSAGMAAAALILAIVTAIPDDDGITRDQYEDLISRLVDEGVNEQPPAVLRPTEPSGAIPHDGPAAGR